MLYTCLCRIVYAVHTHLCTYQLKLYLFKLIPTVLDKTAEGKVMENIFFKELRSMHKLLLTFGAWHC